MDVRMGNGNSRLSYFPWESHRSRNGHGVVLKGNGKWEGMGPLNPLTDLYAVFGCKLANRSSIIDAVDCYPDPSYCVIKVTAAYSVPCIITAVV